MLDNPRIVAQFLGLERRTSRAGRDIIDHGPGQHDDLVNAIAGALLMAKPSFVQDTRVAGPIQIGAGPTIAGALHHGSGW